jgi:hypothetical protein
MLSSVSNLERESQGYTQKTKETSLSLLVVGKRGFTNERGHVDERKVVLEKKLEEEKVLLVEKEREREYWIKCDEVAKRIADKGKTLPELDE